MRKLVLWTAFILLAFSLGAAAKKWYDEKPFENWSEKEVEKLLEKSPWTQTLSYSPPSGGRASVSKRTGLGRGASTGARRPMIYFRAHWLSSPPVRMAFARRALLLDPESDIERLRQFAEREWDQAVVSVTVDANDDGRQMLRGYMAALQRLEPDQVLPLTTLVTKSGKEISPLEYRAPQGDGTGAKFVFPRTLEDGRPLLEPGDREVKFLTQFKIGDNTVKLNLKFKTKDMIFKETLAY